MVGYPRPLPCRMRVSAVDIRGEAEGTSQVPVTVEILKEGKGVRLESWGALKELLSSTSNVAKGNIERK